MYTYLLWTGDWEPELLGVIQRETSISEDERAELERVWTAIWWTEMDMFSALHKKWERSGFPGDVDEWMRENYGFVREKCQLIPRLAQEVLGATFLETDELWLNPKRRK